MALSDEEVEQYYEGFCNGALWPLFHSFPSQLPLETTGFGRYREVNQRFAEATARHYRPGDRVWVHDYQLMLVPRMLRELAEAVHVNPYDIERSAKAYHLALTMPEAERHARMERLRRRVFAYDVQWWATTFLDHLTRSGQRPDHHPLGYSRAADVSRAVTTMTSAASLVLLLDYDGTLVPIAATPDLAQPDRALCELLTRLAARPGTQVHVVSGRGQDVLDEWLGALPVGLHAEHGQWSRAPGGAWACREQPPDTWRARALEILEDFAARTPGSLVEEKRSGLAWHCRMADAEYGLAQANELKVHVSSLLSNAPVEVLSGDKVVELRPYGAPARGPLVSCRPRAEPRAAAVEVGQ